MPCRAKAATHVPESSSYFEAWHACFFRVKAVLNRVQRLPQLSSDPYFSYMQTIKSVVERNS